MISYRYVFTTALLSLYFIGYSAKVYDSPDAFNSTFDIDYQPYELADCADLGFSMEGGKLRLVSPQRLTSANKSYVVNLSINERELDYHISWYDMPNAQGELLQSSQNGFSYNYSEAGSKSVRVRYNYKGRTYNYITNFDLERKSAFAPFAVSITGDSPTGCYLPGQVLNFTATSTNPSFDHFEWTISGNVSPTGTIPGSSVAVTVGSPPPSGVTPALFTVTAYDAGGNFLEFSSFYVYCNDNTNPVKTNPPNITISCTQDYTDTGITGVVSATDNCTPSGQLMFSYTDVLVSSNTCTTVYNRQWRVSDLCGNTSGASTPQQITIRDITAPVISVPPAVTVSCSGSTAPGSTGSATATDDCHNPVTPTYVDAITYDCPGPTQLATGYTINRTWTATDACTNSSSGVQTIRVNPAPAPSFSSPSIAAISCATAASYTPPTLTYTNGQSGNCLISGSANATITASSFNACSGGTISLSWTASGCGWGPITQTATVTVNPAPVASWTPPSLPGSLTCATASSFSAPNATYTNGESGSCAISESVTPVVTNNYDACGGTIDITWTGSGACPPAPYTASIPVSPAPTPTWGTPSLPGSLTCANAGSFSAPNLTYSNSGAGVCLVGGSVTPTVTPNYTACGGTIDIVWAAPSLSCGTMTNYTASITVTPAPTPTWGTPSLPSSVTCNAVASFTAPALTYSNSGSGACLIDGSVSASVSTTYDACGGTINITWIAPVLPCGTMSNYTASIPVDPAPTPTWGTPSLPGSLTCANAGSFSAPSLTYSNSESGGCLVNGSVTPTVTNNYDACGGTIDIIWAAPSLACGTMTNYTASIPVNPAPTPTWGTPSLPGSLTCANAGAFSAPSLTYSNSESGGCLVNGTVTPTVTNNYDACGGTIDIIWAAPSLACGTMTNYTASITISPAPTPTWGTPTLPGNLACSAVSSFTAPDLTYSNSEGGVCLIDGTVSPTIVNNFDACGGTIDITWPAPSLACGTMANYTASITVNPAPTPTWGTPTLPGNLACGAVASFTAPDLTYSNSEAGSCLVDGTVSPTIVNNFDACGGTIDITWPAPSLACGSLPNYTASITVDPAPTPTWGTPSLPSSVACSDVASFTAPDLTYSNSEAGSCLIDGTVSPTITTTYDACGGTIDITWPAPSLACGSIANYTASIPVDPAPTPTWGTPALPSSITCANASSFTAPDLTYSNSESGGCLVDGTVAGSIALNYDACGGTIDITWPAPSLACGTIADYTASIPVDPAPTPTWSTPSLPASLTCADVATFTAPDLTYSNSEAGSCLVDGTVVATIVNNFDACGGTIDITWSGPSLACGTLADYTASIPVDPAPTPSWGAPSLPANLACSDVATFIAPDLTYSNAEAGTCLIDGTVTPTIVNNFDACGGTIDITWAAPTLACGSMTDFTASIPVDPAPVPTWGTPTLPANLACGDVAAFTAPDLTYSNSEAGSCLVDGTISPTIVNNFDACGGTIDITWPAPSLACGSLSDYTASIPVDPAPTPSWGTPTLPPSVACIDVATFTAPDLTYSNSEAGTCLIDGTVSATITTTYDACGGTIDITWPAPTLACGTISDYTVSIPVDPAPTPTWGTPTLPASLSCANAGSFTAPDLSYSNSETGGCLIDGLVAATITLNYDACGGTVDITWPAPTLACGTIADYTASIPVDPAPLPTWGTPTLPANLACADVASFIAPDLTYSNSEGGSCLVDGTVTPTIVNNFDACGGTIDITWTAPSLACGSIADYTASIPVDPAPVPTWGTPALPANLACGDVSTFTAPDLTYSNSEAGSCLIDGIVTPTIVNNFDACGGTIDITWSAPSLACGSIADYTASIPVDPAPVPVWVAPTLPANLACGDVATFTAPDLTYSNSEAGSCLIDGTISPTVVNNFDACGGTIDITWPAPTLACGSISDYTVSIPVDPAPVPTWGTPTLPSSVACSDVATFSAPDLTYTNSEAGTCLIDGTIAPIVTSTYDACGGSIDITWPAPTLACGTLADLIVSIPVDPAADPVWDATPAIGPITCSEAESGTFTIPVLGYSNSEAGSCDVSGTSNGIITNTTFDACGGTVEITYSAAGLPVCFSLTDVTVTVTVVPAPSPSWDPTPSIPDISCAEADASSFIIPPLNYTNGESGTCEISGTINGVISSSSYTSCGGSVTVTYPAPSLPCSGLSDVTVSVNVLPALSPVWDPTPSFPNISCQDAETGTITIPQLGYTNSETGACEISGLIDGVITSPAFDECGGTLVITYPAPTLACGSLPDITVSVTVDPAPAPTWGGYTIPTDLTCDDATIFVAPTITYSNSNSGSCLIENTVTPVVTPSFDMCGGTITVEYPDQDYGCGTLTGFTEVITVQPASAPVFTSTPADATIACDAVGAFSPPNLTYDNSASGGCSISGTVAPSVTLNTLDCNDFIYVTWSYTDACNRLLEYTQTIEVIDDQPPTFTVPPSITLTCDQDPYDLGLTGDVTDEADNCATNLDATYTDNASQGCNGTGSITRTWTLSDDCGNVTTRNQTITIVDDEDPVISCPGDISLSCDISELPPYNDFFEFQTAGGTGFDNCGLNQASFGLVSETSNGGTCPEIVTRVYQIEDNCGNVATCSQIITINDTEAPTINGVPSDVTVNCGSIPPAPVLNVDVTASDNCTINSFTVNETNVPGSCESTYQIVRTYTAIDACGNSATETQTVTVINCFPIVTVNISPDEICEGGSSVISATVSGVFTNPAYQWEFSPDHINWSSAGSGSSITITNATSANAGFYRVTVADAPGNLGDPNCSIVSNEAYLSVIAHVETNLSEIVCPGEIVTVGSTNFSTPGTYDVTLTSSAGCDSIVHLTLANYTLQTTNLVETICDGGTVNVGGSLFNTTGNYTVVVPDVHGCDSTIHLDLTVKPNIINNQSLHLCFGEDVTIGGQTFNTTGNYTINLQTTFGCDSIINLNLVVEPKLTKFLDEQICQGDTYNLYGTIYSISGNYSTVVPGSAGCDTTVTLNLDVVTAIQKTVNRTICLGDSIQLGSSYYNTSGTYTGTFVSQAGCDSIVTLNLTVVDNIITTLDEVICEGDSYSVGSNNYTTSGTYQNTFTSHGGCDSIVTLHLTVVPHRDSTIVADICQGSSYSVGGNSYNTTGVHTVTVQNAYGCDSTITLDLTVHPEYTQTSLVEICEGESLTTPKGTYSTSGTYQEDYISTFGCDSTVVIRLTVRPVFDRTITRQVCEGETVTIGSHTYNSTGNYTDSLQTRFGCDSVIHLNLTVLQELVSNFDLQICDGQSYVFGSQTLNTSGTYTETFASQAGCDSVVTLNLSVVPQITTTLDEQICEGDVFYLGSTPYSTSGTYTGNFTSVAGCDSIVTLNLTVESTIRYSFDQPLCEGESIVFNGSTITKAGTYRDTLPSAGGCDSIVTMRVQLLNSYSREINQQICNGVTIDFGGQTLSTSGTYVDTLTSTNGCDSIITLNLSVLPEITKSITKQICTGQTFDFNGAILTTSGTYVDTLQTSGGCDSIVTLNLSVLPALLTDLDVQLCTGQTYDFNGKTLTVDGTYTDTLTTMGGCDSIITLTLVFNDNFQTELDQKICEGETYDFFGQILDQTGTYTHTLASTAGCDSIITLNLEVSPSFSESISAAICQGESYTFNGQTLNASGVYVDTLQSAGGCDSIVTLDLTVNEQYSQNISRQICEGQSFTFDGQTLTASGTYTANLTTVNGCDSIVILDLQVLPQLTETLNVEICSGQSYTFNGQNLNIGGTYTANLTSSNGCDSIVTLNLSVLDKIRRTIDQQICSGQTYNFGGKSLTTAGTYQDTLVSAFGCDSIVTLNLEVLDQLTSTLDQSICNGETFTFDGQTLNSSGTYTATLTATSGCDSVVTLNLTVNEQYAQSISRQICEGQSFAFNGQTLTTTGTYTANLTTVNGCDSIITLDLQVLPQLTETLDVEICASQSYVFDGQTLNTSGTYTANLTSANGCDSIVTLNLAVLDKIRKTINQQICSGQSYTFGGKTISIPGTYADTLTSAFGCDSIVTLNLEVLDQLTTTLDASICSGETYTFDGQALNSSGTYTASLTASSGCDSIVTLNLLVIDPVIVDQSASICAGETYSFDGKSLTASGAYSASYTSAAGCDSIINLTLEVLPAPTITISEEICEGQTYAFFGQNLSTSGTYQEIATSANGCDSTVILELTVVKQKNKSINRTICSSQVFSFDGQDLNTTGTYTATFTSVAGCDSIVTLNLVVADLIQSTIKQQICEGQSYTFGGKQLTTSGTYTDTLTTSAGCDSIVTLELEVSSQIKTTVDQTICEGETFTLAGKSFTTTGVYTINLTSSSGCDSIITLNLDVLNSIDVEDEVTLCEGESIDYQGLLINASGDYEVTLTSASGCDSIIHVHATVLDAYREDVSYTLCQGDSIFIDGQSYTQAASFSKTYQSASGCDSIVTYSIEIIPEKTLVGIDQDICLGDDAILKVNAANNLDLYWEGPGLSCTECRQPKVTPTETTTYTVKTIGCTGDTISSQVTVTVYEAPDMVMPENVEIKKGESSTLTVQTSSPDVILDWYANGELICSDCKSITVNPDKTTTYTVEASNPAGCMAVADFIVFVADDCEFDKIEIANAMTPNHDGRNDQFLIRNSGSSTLESLKIFNRWGELIFSTKNVENELWDGTYKNTPLNSGVYVYLLEGHCAAGDKFVKSGNISIIR